jgi:nucleoside-diphosphate-sugar epimerase
MLNQFSHLIIGCGYLGRRVAANWLQQGRQVGALTRGHGDQLLQKGITPIVGDVLQLPSIAPSATTVLYAVGMDRSAGKTFREVYVEGLRNVLDWLPAPKRFIYVSSTSVYGQADGEWVDESSPTEPNEENGQVVLDAERLLRSKIPTAIILRFAGIYGPGRIRLAAVEKGEPLAGDPNKWLNLIHVDDGARAIVAAADRADAGGTYLIADDRPVRRREYYSILSELLQAPAPQFKPLEEGNSPRLRDRANRRISNHKMREQLGMDLAYPDFVTGLRASI